MEMIKTVIKWNFDKILMRVEAAQKLQEADKQDDCDKLLKDLAEDLLK